LLGDRLRVSLNVFDDLFRGTLDHLFGLVDGSEHLLLSTWVIIHKGAKDVNGVLNSSSNILFGSWDLSVDGGFGLLDELLRDLFGSIYNLVKLVVKFFLESFHLWNNLFVKSGLVKDGSVIDNSLDLGSLGCPRSLEFINDFCDIILTSLSEGRERRVHGNFDRKERRIEYSKDSSQSFQSLFFDDSYLIWCEGLFNLKDNGIVDFSRDLSDVCIIFRVLSHSDFFDHSIDPLVGCGLQIVKEGLTINDHSVEQVSSISPDACLLSHE